MGENIKNKVQQIGRTARLLVWGWASCLLFATVVAVLLIFGALDYLFRQQDLGMRYLVFAGAVAAIGYAVWHLCRVVFAARFSDLDVARLIERRVGGLGDRLSSALSFLQQNEHWASQPLSAPAPQSLAMQRAVIEEASRRLATVDAKEVFDYRALQRAAGFCLLALAAVLAISFADLQTILTGAQRVLAPWSDVSWPRRNELYFENRVDKIAAGAEFVAVVKDGKDHLPGHVKFEFAFLDQDAPQARDMNRLNDSMVFRLGNVTSSFRYRALGGDDQTNWYLMEVLPAPRIEQIEFRVKPPAYTKLPPRTFADDVKAITGSSLELTAKSSQPLHEAHARWAADGQEHSLSARVESDGRTVRFPVDEGSMLVESSGVLRLELLNAESLSGGLERRFQIVAVPDMPPAIDVASRDSLSAVTLQGKIHLHVAVREDIRLEQVDLVFNTLRSAANEPKPLWRRDSTDAAVAAGLTNERESDLGERYETDVEIDVRTIDGVQVGDVVTFYVTATDAKQQTAVSNQLSFRVADATELVEQLMARQNQIYEKLLEGLRQQKMSNQQLETVRAHLEAQHAVDDGDGNGLYAAQLAETEVARQLGEPRIGAFALLEQILRECEANSIDRRQFVAQIEKSHRAVGAIIEGPLAAVQFQLASANRLTRQADANLRELQNSLAQLGGQQREIAARLEELVGRFSQVDELREAIKTWIQLRRQQDEISAATKGLSREFVGQSFEQLSQENRQRIGVQADMQIELARNTQQAVWKLERLVKKFDESSAEGRAIGQALELTGELLIDVQMRQTGEEIRKNQLGKAAGQQQQLIQSLDQVLETLQGSRNVGNDDQLRNAVQAQAAVNELVQQQSEITEAIRNAQTANKPDRDELLQDAGAKQREIAAKLQKLRDQLQVDENDSAARQADAAEQAASETAEQISRQELADGERSSEETERRLQQLQRSLDQQIQGEKSRQDDLRNQQAKALLDELVEQQRDLLTQFQDYQALDQTQKQSNRARLPQFAGIERELAEATERLADGFAGQIAFSFVLSQVVDHLDGAANMLQQFQADEETEFAIDAALAGMERVRQALERRPATNSDQQMSSDENQSDQSQPQIAAAEVALLVASQQLILDRTAQLDLSRAEKNGELSPQQTAEVKKLVEQESRLLEIVNEYLKKMQAEHNESEPEVPDIPDLPIPEVPLPDVPGL